MNVSSPLANKADRTALANDSLLLGANPALYIAKYSAAPAFWGLGIFAGLLFLGNHISPLYALMMVPGGAIGSSALHWSASRWAKRERDWLRRLPFPFEAEHLLTILENKSERCRLTLTIELSEPIEYRQEVKTPPLLARFTRRATSKSMTYEIESPSFRTVRATVNKQGQVKYDNSDVYAWFKSVVLKVLLPLHQEWPIESVTVQAARG